VAPELQNYNQTASTAALPARRQADPSNTMTLLNRFSMRASLIATIVVMGLLGLALALFTARLYESVAREAHQAALAELLFHRITDLSRDIDVEAQLRIAPLLSDQAFIESLRANKADIARCWHLPAPGWPHNRLHYSVRACRPLPPAPSNPPASC
jgi:hypothetical protein